MSYSALKNTAKELTDQASFLVEITNEKEYEQELSLMDELVDDYDNQHGAMSIHSYWVDWVLAGQPVGYERTPPMISQIRDNEV